MRFIFLLFILYVVYSENVLNYQFRDEDIIYDKGTHEGNRVNLIYPGNVTRKHLGRDFMTLSEQPSIFLYTDETIPFLKPRILASNTLKLGIQMKLSRPDIYPGEYCLFCLKKKDPKYSALPIKLCDYFDLAIMWSGRSIRFLMRTSTHNCEWSISSYYVRDEMVGSVKQFDFSYNTTHLNMLVDKEAFFTSTYYNNHDVSNWSDSLKIFIGPIKEIKRPFDLLLYSIVLDVGKIDEKQQTKKFFTDEEDEDEPAIYTQNRENTRSKGTTINPELSSHAHSLSTLTQKKEVSKNNGIHPELFSSQYSLSVKQERVDNVGLSGGSGSDGSGSGSGGSGPSGSGSMTIGSGGSGSGPDGSGSGDDRVCRNVQICNCSCKRRIGIHNILAASNENSRCYVPKREFDQGKCGTDGSCQCDQEEPMENKQCNPCMIPIYWSYHNTKNAFNVSSSELKFVVARETATSIQNSYPKQINFHSGNHHIVHQSVVTFEKSCNSVGNFEIKIYLCGKMVGYLDIEYEGNQQWKAYNHPLHIDFWITGIIMMKELELRITEKTLMHSSLKVTTGTIDIPVMLTVPTVITPRPYVYFKLSRTIPENPLFQPVDEIYMISKNHAHVETDYFQYSLLEPRYGYSQNMEDLYSFRRENIQGSSIIAFGNVDQVNQSFTTIGGSKEIVGPFRIYQCIRARHTCSEPIYYYDGSRLNFLSNNDSLTFCVIRNPPESLSQELVRIDNKSTDPIFIASTNGTCRDKCDDLVCKWYDRCGACDGDNSTCSIFENCPIQQKCFEDYSSCDVIHPISYDGYNLSQVLNAKYTIRINTTITDPNDVLNIVWKCKNPNTVIPSWAFSIEETIRTCHSNHTLYQKLGTLEITFGRLFECYTGNATSILNEKNLDLIRSVDEFFLIKLKSIRSNFTYQIPCRFNIHTQIEAQPESNNTCEIKQGKVFLIEFTKSPIRTLTKPKHLFFKDNDMHMIFQTCYVVKMLNETIESIDIVQQIGPLVEVVGLSQCSGKIGKTCCQFWKIKSVGNYYESHTLLVSDVKLKFKIGHHELFLKYLIIQFYQARVQIEAPKLVIKNKKPHRLRINYFKTKELKECVDDFYGNERVYVKMFLDRLGGNFRCERGNMCPLGSDLLLKLRLINLCVAKRSAKEHPRSCEDAGGRRYTLLDMRGSTPTGGMVWGAKLESINNCSSAAIFSYLPKNSVFSRTIGRRLFLEVFWNSFDIQDDFHGFTEFESIDDDERFFGSQESHNRQCDSGWFDREFNRCLHPIAWCGSFALQKVRGIWIVVLAFIFIILIVFLLQCCVGMQMMDDGFFYANGKPTKPPTIHNAPKVHIQRQDFVLVEEEGNNRRNLNINDQFLAHFTHKKSE